MHFRRGKHLAVQIVRLFHHVAGRLGACIQDQPTRPCDHAQIAEIMGLIPAQFLYVKMLAAQIADFYLGFKFVV